MECLAHHWPPRAPAPDAAAPLVPSPGAVLRVPAKSRPTDDEIITVLVQHYRVHESKVIEWLLGLDLKAASDRMVTEFQS